MELRLARDRATKSPVFCLFFPLLKFSLPELREQVDPNSQFIELSKCPLPAGCLELGSTMPLALQF